MRRFIAILALTLVSTVVEADLNVKTYAELLQSGETEKAIVENYVGGVGKGYLWANTVLKKKKEVELFCYDGDYSIEDFNNIAREAVNVIISHPKYDETDDTSVEMLLLYKLQELHPCTKKVKKK